MTRRTDNVINSGGVLIVGAGLAGLFTALKIKGQVTVLSAASLGSGASSTWAQGGIAAAIGPGDSPELHASDTEAAGAGIVDPKIARLIANEAAGRIEDLARLGVPFDRDAKGNFVLGREAAHCKNRIVRVTGDRAGAERLERDDGQLQQPGLCAGHAGEAGLAGRKCQQRHRFVGPNECHSAFSPLEQRRLFAQLGSGQLPPRHAGQSGRPL